MNAAWWADNLAWVDPWLLPWFTVGAVATSRLEALAFLLSIAMVACNLRVHVAGWPLAMASSALYGLLFARSRLYGEACLQGVFIAMSAWGWWRWARDPARGQADAGVHTQTRSARLWTVLLALTLWAVLGWMLHHVTDSDAAYADAFPTALSLVGQWLLARKLVENWPCWFVVNIASMGLFALKQLWLTVLLYGVFAVLSLVGWHAWRQRLKERVA